MFFEQIARPLVKKGIPVIPLNGKIAFQPDWNRLASIDLSLIAEWNKQYPDANVGAVAKAEADGFWFLDIDREGYAAEIEKQTGQKMPETLMVRSRPGRGHYYFKASAASLQMGNRQAADGMGELWSARCDNRYVVAFGSVHPDTGATYEVIRNAAITEAPQWLIDHLIANSMQEKKKTATGHAELDDNSPIIEGNRNNALTSILGKARQVLKMDKQQLLEYGLSVNEKRCNPPLSEAEVRTIANSVGSYEVKERGVLEFNGVVQNQGPVAPVVAAPQEIVPADVRIIPYPEFPRWIMKGTSIYEGLVKPTCDVNTRFPEFMFVPAMTLVLNYLAMKVTVVGKKVKPGIFMVSIGRKGRVIKSGSVEDAIDYLRTAGILGYASSATKNAEAKSLIWQAGSPEGLGKQMARTNCKNAVLFYDELGTLTSKAKIEGSSFGESLCQVYESGMFSNTIKAERDNYTFEPNSYCISIIACCTDKKFASKMGPIVASSNGMDERFFYLYQPEVLPDMQPYKYVNCSMAAAETKRLIDKAVMKGVYHFADEYQPKLNALSAINNRLEHRAEKWALFFAVDLGRDEIDDECVERAEALCKYEQAAKEYLSVPETTTFEGQLQSEIIGLLQRGGGKVTMRQLGNSMKPEKHGTTVWKKVFNGLIDNGWTKETGTGKTGDPKSLVLMRNPDNDDD